MKVFIATLNLLILFSLSWVIWKREFSSIRKFYWPALFIKLSAGIVLGVVYSTYYTVSDTFFFFTKATEWSQIALTDASRYFDFLLRDYEGYFSGEGRMYFMIKLTSIFSILTGDNYWITSCWFSFMTFLTAWYLTKTISEYFPSLTIPSVIAFLFFPSCVFWSSGIIKESLAVSALWYLSAVFLRVWFRERISLLSIACVLLSIWVGWKLKYYYFGLFVPVLFAGWVVRQTTQTFGIPKGTVQLLTLLLTMAMGLLAISFLHPNFSLSRLTEVIVSSNQAFVRISSPDDVIHYYQLDSTWISLIMNSPWALFSGLFRPFIWEANSIMQVISSIENLILFVLTAISIRYIPLIMKAEHSLLLMMVIIYSVLLCVFLALSSPNFGTLARYRVGFLPFMVLLITSHHPFLVKPFSKLL